MWFSLSAALKKQPVALYHYNKQNGADVIYNQW